MTPNASNLPPVMPEALRTVCSFLNETRRLLDQLEQIARAAAALTRSDHADITLFDSTLRRFIPLRSNHVFLHQGEDDAADWIRSNGRALLVPDLNYAASDSDLALYNRDIASYLGVPIAQDGRVEGALIVFNRNPRSYDAGEQPALEALAALAAVALNQKRLSLDLEEASRTLLKLSLTDPTTGVATRHQFDQMLQREWRRAVSEGLSISLMQIEIDHFESMASERGAGEAQRTLSTAARALHSALYRAGDLIARLDDTRLAVLLPDTDAAGAKAIARRLRRDVTAAAPTIDGTPLTLSIGLSSFDTLKLQRGVHGTAELLLERSEAALEQATASGGNQVVAQDLAL